LIISIDGPAGTGKSTIAKNLARALSFEYVDTGAMYRAVAWYFCKHNIPLEDAEIEVALKHVDLSIETKDGDKHYFVGKIDVSQDIRSREISQVVSIIAANPLIRVFLVSIQRKYANSHNIVCEGRDIGSVVFPQAELKIFLTADPLVRAKRRYDQLKEKKIIETKTLDLQSILEEITKRDHLDSVREHSPLIKAKDAKEVDTSHMIKDEVLETILKLYDEVKNKNLL